MADVLSICARFAMGTVVYLIWTKLVDLPKPRSRDTFVNALFRARRAEIVRLASVARPTTVPGLSRPLEERAILSMPVFLYESASRRRLFPPVSRAGRKLVWEHRASPGGSSLFRSSITARYGSRICDSYSRVRGVSENSLSMS